MKRLLLCAVAMSCAMTCAYAQSYDHYYANLPVELARVRDVIVPSERVNVMDYGAAADGKALDKQAFDAAIDALAGKGGGHLDVPAGTYLCAPIELKSNIDLHLCEGATLLFTTDKTLYLSDKTSKALACIRASRAENVCITGSGVINGQGEYWRPVKKSKVSEAEWAACLKMGGTLQKEIWLPYDLNNGIPSIGADAKQQEKMRNHLVQFTDCNNVLVQGVKLMNSPKFHLVPTRCRNLIVDGITIECPWNAQNGDGMDPGNVQTALIVGCTVSCGDDGICMKGGVGEAGVKAGPNSDFLIQGNTVYRAHGGFVIGSEFSGGMHRIVVRDCVFDGTDIGLRFKSAAGRGGTCSDIYCYDIQMKNIRNEAVSFVTSYEDQGALLSATSGDDKSAFYPDFCNISIYNVQVSGAKTAMKIDGIPGHPVHDITLRDVLMSGCKNGLVFKNAVKIRLQNCLIQSKNGDNIDQNTCVILRR